MHIYSTEQNSNDFADFIDQIAPNSLTVIFFDKASQSFVADTPNLHVTNVRQKRTSVKQKRTFLFRCYSILQDVLHQFLEPCYKLFSFLCLKPFPLKVF